jgi:putative transposase
MEAHATADAPSTVVVAMKYPTNMTNTQWALVKAILAAEPKRGPKHGRDLRRVVDAMLYVTHTGCQWRYLPADFGPWTRVWSQFRRWSDNGTFVRLLAGLHEEVRLVEGRAEAKPSMIVIDTHLARAASNGGRTFHDQGGPRGWTKGAKRIVAVDVTGYPLCARVVPASMTESACTQMLLEDITRNGQAERLELVLVDKGVSKKAAHTMTKEHQLEVRQYGWPVKPVDPETGKKIFKPLKYSWRVETAHAQLGKSRRLAKSFENTPESASAWLQLACISMLLNDIE